jgi:hypothetical protein
MGLQSQETHFDLRWRGGEITPVNSICWKVTSD